MKTFYLIRSWQGFHGWILCIFHYSIYIKYCEIIKKFKDLKIAIVDYEALCPKTLLLALEKNNIKTVATQERFVHTFLTSWVNVMLDTYYVASEFAANIIKNSKYYDIKNVIPVGQYRSDYISIYKKHSAPREISKAKDNGKKILIALGFDSSENWFESYIDLNSSWITQMDFLEDMIRLSQNLENTFIVLRYKTLNWSKKEYFKKIIDKIYRCENIILSNNYEEAFYSYKLCAHADLIIARATSIADECLANEIPVLFHEYTRNMTSIVSHIPNYLSPELACYDFEELYQKCKSILNSDQNQLREEVKKMNERIYYVSEQEQIKTKIIKDLEKRLV